MREKEAPATVNTTVPLQLFAAQLPRAASKVAVAIVPELMLRGDGVQVLANILCSS